MWKDTGKPDDILEANRLILEDIERDVKEGCACKGSEILGRVKIGEGVNIVNSKIVGPVIIGNKAKIDDSYIGPFTSLSDGVEVRKSEIEYSVVLENTKINNIKGRFHGCDFPFPHPPPQLQVYLRRPQQS
jgi:glucose-1-phosphate thymidylyltransferase